MLKTNSKLRNFLLILVAIVVAVVVRLGLGYVTNSAINQFQLANAVAEADKQTPIMVDSDTRLDKVEMVSANTIKYNYTLVNYTKADLGEDLTDLKAAIRDSIITLSKKETKLDELRENNITQVYSYKDKDGVLLFDISLLASQY